MTTDDREVFDGPRTPLDRAAAYMRAATLASSEARRLKDKDRALGVELLAISAELLRSGITAAGDDEMAETMRESLRGLEPTIARERQKQERHLS